MSTLMVFSNFLQKKKKLNLIYNSIFLKYLKNSQLDNESKIYEGISFR